MQIVVCGIEKQSIRQINTELKCWVFNTGRGRHWNFSQFDSASWRQVFANSITDSVDLTMRLRMQQKGNLSTWPVTVNKLGYS
jgi:hypothetical protein